MTDKRFHEIERRLADLGPLDGWHSEITNEGDLALCVPPRFLWENNQIVLGNMEGSTADDHALMEFLGDAPRAVGDLLELVRHYRAALEQTVSACEACDQGYVEYSPPGLDAWLPTGDPNIKDEPCPYCGPARKALGDDAAQVLDDIRDNLSTTQAALAGAQSDVRQLRIAIAEALEPGRYGFELLDAETIAVRLTEAYDPFEESTHAT